VYWLDIFLLAFMLLLAWSGFRKGLVREVFDLGGAILGLYVAGYYHRELAGRITSSIALPVGVAIPLAFGLLALGISLFFSLGGLIWSRSIRIPPLRFADTILGAGLGLAKGFLLLMVILTFLTMLAGEGLMGIIAESAVAEQILLTVPSIYSRLEDMLPEKLPILGPKGLPSAAPAL
jgi:membrane protein required for colicin V production